MTATRMMSTMNAAPSVQWNANGTMAATMRIAMIIAMKTTPFSKVECDSDSADNVTDDDSDQTTDCSPCNACNQSSDQDTCAQADKAIAITRFPVQITGGSVTVKVMTVVR